MRQSWLKRVSKMVMRALSGKAAPSRLVCCAKSLPDIILIIRAEDRASGEATQRPLALFKGTWEFTAFLL